MALGSPDDRHGKDHHGNPADLEGLRRADGGALPRRVAEAGRGGARARPAAGPGRLRRRAPAPDTSHCGWRAPWVRPGTSTRSTSSRAFSRYCGNGWGAPTRATSHRCSRCRTTRSCPPRAATSSSSWTLYHHFPDGPAYSAATLARAQARRSSRQRGLPQARVARRSSARAQGRARSLPRRRGRGRLRLVQEHTFLPYQYFVVLAPGGQR